MTLNRELGFFENIFYNIMLSKSQFVTNSNIYENDIVTLILEYI